MGFSFICQSDMDYAQSCGWIDLLISDTDMQMHCNLKFLCIVCVATNLLTQKSKFMGPTWGPPGSCRPQMAPMLAPWTFYQGISCRAKHTHMHTHICILRHNEHPHHQSFEYRDNVHWFPCFMNTVRSWLCLYYDSQCHAAPTIKQPLKHG